MNDNLTLNKEQVQKQETSQKYHLVSLDFIAKITNKDVNTILDLLKPYNPQNYFSNNVPNLALAMVQVASFNDVANSNHLHLVQLEGIDFPIVCGASNLKPGLKTLLANVGAMLPSLTITEREVFGIASKGMLVGLTELFPKNFKKRFSAKYDGIIDFEKLGLASIESLEFNFANIEINKDLKTVLNELALLPVTKPVFSAYQIDLYLIKLGQNLNKILPENRKSKLEEITGIAIEEA